MPPAQIKPYGVKHAELRKEDFNRKTPATGKTWLQIAPFLNYYENKNFHFTPRSVYKAQQTVIKWRLCKYFYDSIHEEGDLRHDIVMVHHAEGFLVWVDHCPPLRLSREIVRKSRRPRYSILQLATQMPTSVTIVALTGFGKVREGSGKSATPSRSRAPQPPLSLSRTEAELGSDPSMLRARRT
ncbi:hypothetical protein J6590_001703 [Homalodisca vitripennis]|nr:hypothetical protein J6590_001703 [Homalodisca vitripennis]